MHCISLNLSEIVSLVCSLDAKNRIDHAHCLIQGHTYQVEVGRNMFVDKVFYPSAHAASDQFQFVGDRILTQPSQCPQVPTLALCNMI
jgi:hypothetical protein